MKKFIVILILASLACGQSASVRVPGKALATMPATGTPLAHPSPTPELLATVTKPVDIVGKWNLRSEPDHESAHVAFIGDQPVIVITENKGWLFVQTVGDQPVCGWVHSKAIGAK